MKKNFITITLLMGISLFGIMLIQWFWMQKAISVKEEQFDRAVNEALARTAYRIERNQNALYFTNMLAGNDFNTNQNPQKQPLNSDTSLIQFNKNWNGNKHPNNEKGNDFYIKKKETNGIQTITYGFDTVIVSGNTTQRIQSFSSISHPNLNISNAHAQQVDMNINFDQMQNQLNNAMEQMLFEFSLRDIPLEELLDKSIITPTLKYELKNLKIPLKFEYAVSNANGNLYGKLKSQGFQNKNINDSYKTSLFPNDLVRSTEKLHLYFPEKRSFIFHSLYWLLVGSIVFTFIILLTFYYTLKTILNQKKVSEIKTDFINNMTHEFKTPIATISLAADAISNPKVFNEKDKIQRFTSIIKEENKRMNRQVESVLKMSLIDKKDFNLNKTKTDVHPLIEKAVQNISIQIEQKGGFIEFLPQASHSIVDIDETHFVNIIYNLLDNANKYIFDKTPEIKVVTMSNSGYLRIDIVDNGIGMDKDTQDKIFDKFYRYSTGNVHTVKGFGLGLSYVKAITLALNGDISVRSSKGKGSTFSIKLPLKNE